MVFYTVDRANSLEENTFLELLTEDPFSNPFWYVEGLFTQEALQAHLDFLFPEGLSRHGWHYSKVRHTYGVAPNFTHEVSPLVEMNFEYVRKAFYADKPSRLQSMFACETLAEAQFFRNRFCSENAEVPIFELSGNASFKADMNMIFLGTQNLAGSLLAHNYWSGQASSNPFWEVVIPLPVRVNHRVG